MIVEPNKQVFIENDYEKSGIENNKEEKIEELSEVVKEFSLKIQDCNSYSFISDLLHIFWNDDHNEVEYRQLLDFGLHGCESLKKNENIFARDLSQIIHNDRIESMNFILSQKLSHSHLLQYSSKLGEIFLLYHLGTLKNPRFTPQACLSNKADDFFYDNLRYVGKGEFREKYYKSLISHTDHLLKVEKHDFYRDTLLVKRAGFNFYAENYVEAIKDYTTIIDNFNKDFTIGKTQRTFRTKCSKEHCLARYLYYRGLAKLELMDEAGGKEDLCAAQSYYYYNYSTLIGSRNIFIHLFLVDILLALGEVDKALDYFKNNTLIVLYFEMNEEIRMKNLRDDCENTEQIEKIAKNFSLDGYRKLNFDLKSEINFSLAKIYFAKEEFVEADKRIALALKFKPGIQDYYALQNKIKNKISFHNNLLFTQHRFNDLRYHW